MADHPDTPTVTTSKGPLTLSSSLTAATATHAPMPTGTRPVRAWLRVAVPVSWPPCAAAACAIC